MRVKTLGCAQEDRDARPDDAHLVFWIGRASDVGTKQTSEHLRERFPAAQIVAVSSSGGVLREVTADDAAVLAVIRFQDARVQAVEARITAGDDFHRLGADLAGRLNGDDLRAVCLMPATQMTQGGFAASAIVAGFARAAPAGVVLFGANAGGGGGNLTPCVGLNRPARENTVVAVGFYGSNLQVSSKTGLGYRRIGPVRRITRAEGNVIYEFDGKPALDLYLSYAGMSETTFDPMKSRFAFFVNRSDGAAPLQAVIRIDRAQRSLCFLDQVSTGALAQLCYSSIDGLIDAAADAARAALDDVAATGDRFAFVANCAIRQRVLGQQARDEVDAIWKELAGVPSVGFFSFGEIGRNAPDEPATLMNQAVAITVLGER